MNTMELSLEFRILMGCLNPWLEVGVEELKGFCLGIR